VDKQKKCVVTSQSPDFCLVSHQNVLCDPIRRWWRTRTILFLCAWRFR